MGVNLCRSNRLVTEHFLNCSQVCTAFNQMCCEGVPEGMRTDVLFQLYLFTKPLDDCEDHHASKLASSLIQEYKVLLSLLYDLMIADFIEVDFDVFRGNTPDGN